MMKKCIIEWMTFLYDISPLPAPLIYCPISSSFYQQIAGKQLSVPPQKSCWAAAKISSRLVLWAFSPATWDRGSSCPCFQLTLGLVFSKGGMTWVFSAQLQCSWEPQSLEISDVSNAFMEEYVQKNHPKGDKVPLY